MCWRHEIDVVRICINKNIINVIVQIKARLITVLPSNYVDPKLPYSCSRVKPIRVINFVKNKFQRFGENLGENCDSTNTFAVLSLYAVLD